MISHETGDGFSSPLTIDRIDGRFPQNHSRNLFGPSSSDERSSHSGCVSLPTENFSANTSYCEGHNKPLCGLPRCPQLYSAHHREQRGSRCCATSQPGNPVTFGVLFFFRARPQFVVSLPEEPLFIPRHDVRAVRGRPVQLPRARPGPPLKILKILEILKILKMIRVR